MDQSAVTSAGKAYIPQAVKVLNEAFQEDPVITYLLNSLSPEARIAYLPAYFNALLTAATLNEAKITEINGWKCCGVLVPPGEKVDNPRTWLQAGLIPFLWNMGLRGARKTLLEYTPISDRAKAKAMKPGEKFYYVFFMGTRNDSRKQGLASKVIKHYQDISSAENLPLWLEATTAFSRDLYLKLGFEIVQEMVLGPDTTAPSGLPLKGGDGVKIWGMIWRSTS